MNIQDAFFKYWDELGRHKGWIDIGMGMPPVGLFFPTSELHDDLVQGMDNRADYQPQVGPMYLRQAIAEYEMRRTGVEYSLENIMVVAGAIRGFSLTVDCLIDVNSHLLEIVPTYPLLSGYARYSAKRLNNRVITIVPRDTIKFSIQQDEILPYITESTLLYLTNPNNPTGLYVSSLLLSDIVAACEKTHSYIIIDESCDIPLIDNREYHAYGLQNSSVIRIQSFSKTLLLAGYRAGYIVASDKIIKLLSSHYAFSDANAPVVFNKALVTYLQKPELLNYIVDVSRKKIQKSMKILQSSPRVKHLINPEGCYYIFLKVDYHKGSWSLFNYLLKRGVNVVPGVLFGIEEREALIRIGCGHDDNTLDQGLARLLQALEAL